MKNKIAILTTLLALAPVAARTETHAEAAIRFLDAGRARLVAARRITDPLKQARFSIPGYALALASCDEADHAPEFVATPERKGGMPAHSRTRGGITGLDENRRAAARVRSGKIGEVKETPK